MDKKTVRIHDGIVGVLIVLATALGFKVNPMWFYVPGLVGLLMIISSFTGFCPVYCLLNLCGMKCCDK